LDIKSIIRKILGVPNSIYNFILLKYCHVKFGVNLRVSGRLFLVSNSKNGIVIGNNVAINSCRGANPIGGDVSTILFAKGKARITIGDNVGMSNVTIFACESISIGNYVLLGGSVKIYDTDFHWLDFKKRISKPGGITKPVVINDGAFIGAHTLILKGVTIGENSIVGAGSVVTKNIPNGEIWAGNPARFIRKVDKMIY
jgi:acetyltransferase-like isoleucine patch superfamily enzyme